MTFGKNKFFVIFSCLACSLALGGEDPDAWVIGPRPLSMSEISTYSSRLADPDDAKAIETALQLGVQGRLGAAKLLVEFYQKSNSPRRLASARALASINDPAHAESLILFALGDTSQPVRELAAREAAKFVGPDAVLQRASSCARDAAKYSSLIRSHAVHTAALVGGKNAEGLLREMLDTPDDDVAIAAAEELSACRDLASVDALLKCLGSERLELRSVAAWSLEKISGKAYGFDLVQWAGWRKDALEKSSSGILPPLESAPYAEERKPVDLLIVFDTTASFLHVWADVGKAIESVLRELVKNEPAVRIGLVRYRSLDPRATLKYTLKVTPPSFNTEAVRKELALASFGGGSGALHEGLRAAVFGTAWRAHARKVILLIGDDSPSSPVENAMQVSINLAREAGIVDGIQINTLFCRTTAGDENRQTYRLIAAAGIGRFYEFNKAERHLVEMSAEEIDVRQTEFPTETARKWILPRAK